MDPNYTYSGSPYPYGLDPVSYLTQIIDYSNDNNKCNFSTYFNFKQI